MKFQSSLELLPECNGGFSQNFVFIMMFQSSLELLPECNTPGGDNWLQRFAVSILTRAFARVQRALGCLAWSQSVVVSILTRAFARVQQ